MTRTKSTIGISAVLFFASALVGVACSSTPAAPTGSSGSPGSGGNGAAGGHATAGMPSVAGASGSAGSAPIGAGGAGGSAGAIDCTPLPANHLLTDFSPATLKAGVMDNSSWKTTKPELWGNATSLTGGDVFYQGKAASAATVTLHGQTLTVKATIEAGDYAGYMFNFAPKCTNASATQGLQFDILSDSTLGNSTLKVQMQQRSDFPSTASPNTRPGGCVPMDPATQYSECLSPTTVLASSGTTLPTGTTQLPWANFSGGAPVSNVENNQLMAIQWQFECPPDGGTVSASGGDGSGGASGTAGTSAAVGAGTGGVAGSGLDCTGSTAGYCGGNYGAIDCTGSTAGYCSGGAAGSGGGTAGSSGGTAGSSGGPAGSSGGTAGGSGTPGSSGGTAGGSGTPGSSGGTAGSTGTAGSSGGPAGSGGSVSSTPPCVVSFTIDNVTFY